MILLYPTHRGFRSALSDGQSRPGVDGTKTVVGPGSSGFDQLGSDCAAPCRSDERACAVCSVWIATGNKNREPDPERDERLTVSNQVNGARFNYYYYY